MLTQSELGRRAESVLARWQRRRIGLDLAAAGLSLALAGAVFIFRVGAGPPWAQVITLVVLATTLALLLTPRAWLLTSLSKRAGLHCPDCGASLLRYRRRLAIGQVAQTGKCPRCGVDVVSLGDTPALEGLRIVRRCLAQPFTVLLIVVGLGVFPGKFNHDYCHARYRAARTAADSAAVDQILAPVPRLLGRYGSAPMRFHCVTWRAGGAVPSR